MPYNGLAKIMFMNEVNKLNLGNVSNSSKHPKCKGYKYWTDCGYEFDCGYETTIDCDQCKYGVGRKDPEAKCNQ